MNESTDEIYFYCPSMFIIKGKWIGFIERYNYEDILFDSKLENWKDHIILTRLVNSILGKQNKCLFKLFEVMCEKTLIKIKRISNIRLIILMFFFI